MPDIWRIRAIRVRLVYSSTSNHCRGLRDIVSLNFKSTIDNPDAILRSPLESNAVMKTMEQVPDIAFDLASRAWSHRPWNCTECLRSMKVLVLNCQCGRFDRCEGQHSVSLVEEQSLCLECFRPGTGIMREDLLLEARIK